MGCDVRVRQQEAGWLAAWMRRCADSGGAVRLSDAVAVMGRILPEEGNRLF